MLDKTYDRCCIPWRIWIWSRCSRQVEFSSDLKIRQRIEKQEMSLLWSDQDFSQCEVLGACKSAQYSKIWL